MLISILYSSLFYLMLPFILLRLLVRGIKAPDYRLRIQERFGVVPSSITKGRSCLWLHSVSVGETIAAKPLVLALLNQYPQYTLLITTTTPTGSIQVKRQYEQEIAEGRIAHSYMPYDLPGAMSRFLTAVQPAAALFMETEVWPNTLRLCRQKNIPTVLVNGRLSQRSFISYQKFAWLTGPVFSYFSSIAAQSIADAERISHLNSRCVNGNNITVTGSLKLEISVPDDLRRQSMALKNQLSINGLRSIIIAASTHEGEDEIILSAYRQLKETHHPVLLVIVPRHPERFQRVGKLCVDYGFSVVHRSHQQQTISIDHDIMLGDTMGELMLMYGAADIAIVGGSFIDHGGHNMLEPAAWSLPIISGQHVHNFATIAQAMFEENALVLCDNNDLHHQLQDLLAHNERAQQLADNAYQYVDKNGGALEKTLALIDGYLDKR